MLIFTLLKKSEAPTNFCIIRNYLVPYQKISVDYSIKMDAFIKKTAYSTTQSGQLCVAINGLSLRHVLRMFMEDIFIMNGIP